MPSLNLVTTTNGRAAILGAIAGFSSLAIVDAVLSDTNQTAGVGTTSLSSVVATLTTSGSVRVAGSGHALHLLIKDDSSAAYDVRALALRITGGGFIMVYSQSGLIASKAASSSLHLAIDLTVDADTAATITFGNTDYTLPASGETAPGIIELATSAEAIAAADAIRAITPATLAAVLGNDISESFAIPVSAWRSLGGSGEWALTATGGPYDIGMRATAANRVMIAEIPIPAGFRPSKVSFFCEGAHDVSYFSAQATLRSGADAETAGSVELFSGTVVDVNTFPSSTTQADITTVPSVTAGHGGCLRLSVVSKTTTSFGFAELYRARIYGLIDRLP